MTLDDIDLAAVRWLAEVCNIEATQMNTTAAEIADIITSDLDDDHKSALADAANAMRVMAAAVRNVATTQTALADLLGQTDPGGNTDA